MSFFNNNSLACENRFQDHLYVFLQIFNAFWDLFEPKMACSSVCQIFIGWIQSNLFQEAPLVTSSVRIATGYKLNT